MTEGLWKSFIILNVTNDDRIYNELQNYPWVKQCQYQFSLDKIFNFLLNFFIFLAVSICM